MHTNNGAIAIDNVSNRQRCYCNGKNSHREPDTYSSSETQKVRHVRLCIIHNSGDPDSFSIPVLARQTDSRDYVV